MYQIYYSATTASSFISFYQASIIDIDGRCFCRLRVIRLFQPGQIHARVIYFSKITIGPFPPKTLHTE